MTSRALTDRESDKGVLGRCSVADACRLWVESRAHELMWLAMGSERNVTANDLRSRVWRSPEGQVLARLMASPLGDLPVDDPDVAREEGFEILAAGFGDL